MKDEELVRHISVRFSSRMQARISKLSSELKVPASEVIRRAVENQLPKWEGSRRQGVSEDYRNGKA
jgi:predicted DNA-binding protein